MCIAMPMKLIEINNETQTGKVLYSGNMLEVNISLISPVEGDYVLVHAGCAIEIVKKETADEIMEIFKALEEAIQDES